MMIAGQVYRCVNRNCNCEVVVSKPSRKEADANPRCCCGSEMKKPYTAPVMREITGTDLQHVRTLFKRE